jgi:hypothetical protein
MTSVNRGLIIVFGALATLALTMVVLVAIVLDGTAREATIAAAGGLGVAAALFAIFVACHGRTAARYYRYADESGASAALPEDRTDVRETIVLDRAFNTMSGSLRKTREELGRLVEEQAALRRVATLVAYGEPPEAVFTAVATEVGQVLGADLTRLLRYEPDEATTVISVWGGPEDLLPPHTCWTIVGSNIPSMVLHKCAPARMDCFARAVSPLCVYLRQHGVLSGVGTPITVDGHCWGVMRPTSAPSPT